MAENTSLWGIVREARSEMASCTSKKTKQSEYFAKYYKANKEKIGKKNKAWNTANKEKTKEYVAKWKEDNTATLKGYQFERRMKRYGICEEQFIMMVADHDSKCGICRTEFSNAKDLHIDHDHSTGRVRGLLCRRCNMGLGQFKDSIKLLARAARYLYFP